MQARLTTALILLLAWHERIPALAAADPAEPTLWIVDETRAFGCREVQGELVVLLKPELGVLVLATREFPGAEPVGAIEGSRVRFSFPGLRMPEQSAESKNPSAAASPIWGLVVQGVDPPQRAACFGLDRSGLDKEEQLTSRVRRVVEEVLEPLQEDLMSRAVGPRFSSREVILEFLAPPGDWRRLAAREAEPVDLPVPGSQRRYRLVPVIPGPTDRVILLLSVSEERPPGAPSRQVRSVEVGRGEADFDTVPRLRIRIKEIRGSP